MRGISPCTPSVRYIKNSSSLGAEEPMHLNAAIHGGVFRIDKTQPEKSTYPQK
ncbi:MAG: hypothetical protein J6V89_05695 [Acetobacter sp.]|nr:hypothetical protein [Acetobacter sp.]